VRIYQNLKQKNKHSFFNFTGFFWFSIITIWAKKSRKKIVYKVIMKGFYIGFSLCILQTLYYDHKRTQKQKEFNKKMNDYLKKKNYPYNILYF
jgi:hypothetical protein